MAKLGSVARVVLVLQYLHRLLLNIGHLSILQNLIYQLLVVTLVLDVLIIVWDSIVIAFAQPLLHDESSLISPFHGVAGILDLTS